MPNVFESSERRRNVFERLKRPRQSVLPKLRLPKEPKSNVLRKKRSERNKSNEKRLNVKSEKART